MKKLNKKELLITILLVIVIFSIRLPFIDNPPPEAKEMWRQPDTESIARNFVEHKFNIFYPQFNYDGPLPNYVQLEFQITTFLIAILYKIFGYHFFLARLIPTIFFMFSVYFLFKLVKDIYNIKLAWLVIFIYSLIPLNLFYSRAIMPESAVLCFFLGGFYYFYKWYNTESRTLLFLAAVFTAVAISQKTPAIFVGLAMIALSIDKYGLSFIKKRELWLFLLIALVPPFSYTIWASSISEFNFVSGIFEKHIVPKIFTSFFTKESFLFYKETLPKEFTIPLLILALIGLFTLNKKKERALLYLTLAFILETILIVSVIKFDYYLIFLTPIVAILAGKALDTIFIKVKFKPFLITFFLILITAFSFNTVKNDFKVVEPIVEFANFVDSKTEPGDLIVIGTYDPARLSMSSRQGWRANLKYYDYIPKNIKGEVDYFIKNGAKYFVVYDDYIYNDDGSYLKYLEENFKKIDFQNGYKFYILNE